MLTVVTPAASFLLCKLADVKADLGINDTSKDSVLTALIAAASDQIQREFQFLCRQTYRETLPGYGGNILQLKRTPIVSVSSVTHNNEPIVDYTIEDKDAGHLYRRLGWEWTASVGWDMTGYVIPNSEHPDFTVEYVAGYLAADQASSDMPAEIQLSARETVEYWYKALSRSADIESKSVGDLSITYVTGEAARFSVPPRAVTRLEKWRRLV